MPALSALVLLLSTRRGVAANAVYAADDPPLARMMRASEAGAVNALLPEGREAKVCFGGNGRGCLHRLPASASATICGGAPCWGLDASLIGPGATCGRELCARRAHERGLAI